MMIAEIVFWLCSPESAAPLRWNLDGVEIIIRKPKPDLYGGRSGKLPLTGVSLIKKFEGFYPNAYPDPLSGGPPITIGWGATLDWHNKPWHLGDRISRKAADELLIYQLEKDYLPKLEKIPGWEKLNVRQRGALLSFAYNLGADFYGNPQFHSITKVLDRRDFKHIEKVLTLYRNPGSRVEGGLRNRRLTEAWIFQHN